MLAVLERYGLDRDELIEAAGLPVGRLDNPDGRLPLQSLYDLVEAGLEHSGDPYLGIHLGQLEPLDELDGLHFVAMSSATVGEAMRRIERFREAFFPSDLMSWFSDGSWFWHRFEPFGPAREAHSQLAEMVFHGTTVGAAKAYGRRVSPVELHFAHDAAPGLDYDEVFGVPVRHGQPHHQSRYALTIEDEPIAGASIEFGSLVDAHLELRRRLLPGPDSILAQTVNLIDRVLENGRPTVSLVARELGVSERTLQRELGEEGTSVSALIDLARQSRATALLDGGLPVGEVLYFVGYSDRPTFDRAFRRWTGMTSAAYRARARANHAE